MRSSKYQNTVFAVGVSLFIIFVVYTFSGGGSDSIFAYPSPGLEANSTEAYPIPPENSQPYTVENLSSYPAPIQPPVLLTPLPTPSPTPNPGAADVVNITSLLTLQGNEAPDYQLISSGQEQFPNITVTTKILTYTGPLPSTPPIMPNQQSANSDLVDRWEQLLEEGFEGAFPQSGCFVFDNNSGDGYERYWGADDDRPLTGAKAGWPAKGGADGVEPPGNAYPDNLDSWLICGPYDLTDADKFIIDHNYWYQILDNDDYFFTGVSIDGMTFYGYDVNGDTEGWVSQRDHTYGVTGHNSVWVAWVFHSDAGGTFSEGVWIDDLSVWSYDTPTDVCGNVDPGNKGIVLPPYDPTADGEVPTIRPGDTLAVDALKSAGVNWVRLGFIHKNGRIDWRGYDRMIDTLCANGISVLGLINHETLLLDGYNDAATAEAYRQTFVNQAEFIVDYYKGRIIYWEVWNEPNLPVELKGAYIRPEYYAQLLDETYQAIKSANPQAQVLFGGLASAWGDSNDYFAQVYNDFAGTRQFDYFAVHPYANELRGPDPEVYMYADIPPTHNTIVDKFMETMSNHLQGNTLVWVTEVGWNSSKGLPNRPVCHDSVLVTEAEQAAYLKPMFDTLFNEVTLWNQSTTAVEKVIWYQYMDIGVENPCGEDEATTSRAYIPLSEMSTTQSDFTWLFGLYRSDKVTPKPVQCAFSAYPNDCQRVYLPTVLR